MAALIPQALRAVQRACVNHLGQPLVIDGKLGPETRWAIAASLQPIERQLAVRRAQRHLGLLETAPNVDPKGIIAAYLAECGISLPSAYCAAAASCWLAVPGVRLASAVALGKRWAACETPAFGDLAWYPTGGGFGHIEIVIGYNPETDEVMTIGANQNNGIRCIRRSVVGLNFTRAPFPVGDAPPLTIVSPEVPFVRNGQLAGTR